MDLNKEKKIAEKFIKKGGAYVKAEYGDGENGLFVCGDMLALMRIAERIITRVGDLSGEGFVQTWLSVKDIHNCTEKIKNEEVIERRKIMPYEGEKQ